MSNWNIPGIVDRLLDLKEQQFSETDIAEILSQEYMSEFTKDSVGNKWRRLRKTVLQNDADAEIVEENIRLAKQKQRHQDVSRIERKAWRNLARYENFFEDLNNELMSLIDKYDIGSFNFEPISVLDDDNIGILHLSDVHFNEKINLPENKFNFDIANQRLQKFITTAKTYFKARNVSKILVACTGDLIGSDRHLDEMLSQVTNRSKALFLSARIMEHILYDLRQDFNLSFAGVTGNESRIQKEMGFTELLATDNYDYSLYRLLEYILKDTDIEFILQNPTELVVQLFEKYNILLTHGYNLPNDGGVEKTLNGIVNRYNTQNINIHFSLFGHYHSARLTDNFARNSSVAGSNGYSQYNLAFNSKASQNIHIITPKGEIDSIKIDLQDSSDFKGYDIGKEQQLFLFDKESKQKTRNIFRI